MPSTRHTRVEQGDNQTSPAQGGSLVWGHNHKQQSNHSIPFILHIGITFSAAHHTHIHTYTYVCACKHINFFPSSQTFPNSAVAPQLSVTHCTDLQYARQRHASVVVVRPMGYIPCSSCKTSLDSGSQLSVLLSAVAAGMGEGWGHLSTHIHCNAVSDAQTVQILPLRLGPHLPHCHIETHTLLEGHACSLHSELSCLTIGILASAPPQGYTAHGGLWWVVVVHNTPLGVQGCALQNTSQHTLYLT